MDRMMKYYHRYPHQLKCLAILLSATSFFAIHKSEYN